MLSLQPYTQNCRKLLHWSSMRQLVIVTIIAVYTLIGMSVYTAIKASVEQRAHAQEYTKTERFEDAIALYRTLYTQNPHDFASIFEAAVCLLKIGRISEAITLFTSLQHKVVDQVPILYNIGYAHKTAGNLDTAINIYKKALALNSSYDPAHLALGFAYLNQGDFIEGWKQHERYLKKHRKNGEELRALLHTNTIAGKHILLCYEGGFGDTLMFIRYAQRLQTMGANVSCFIQKSLKPLLSLCPYLDTIYVSKPSQRYDAHASLMSLPAIFNDIYEEQFPKTVPYLYADKNLVFNWQKIVAAHPGLKIGLCWQSDVHNDASRMPIARRGMPLACWHALLRTPGVTIFSLQRFDGVEQIAQLPPDCILYTFEDFDTLHGSFMDTAALMSNLDLIITIDSAIAHLAAALGKKTILLLPYATDWRWIYGRTDSPWYPTMVIFKQEFPFNWHTVVNKVYEYLASNNEITINQI
jgi:tetratricopeptide (TPR) repeat protein